MRLDCHDDVTMTLFYCRRGGLAKWELVKNFLITFVGFAGFIAGTIVAVQAIVYDLAHSNANDRCNGGSGGAGGNATTTPSIFTTTDFNNSFLIF